MTKYLVQYREGDVWTNFCILSDSIYEALFWAKQMLGRRYGLCITNIN